MPPSLKIAGGQVVQDNPSFLIIIEYEIKIFFRLVHWLLPSRGYGQHRHPSPDPPAHDAHQSPSKPPRPKQSPQLPEPFHVRRVSQNQQGVVGFTEAYFQLGGQRGPSHEEGQTRLWAQVRRWKLRFRRPVWQSSSCLKKISFQQYDRLCIDNFTRTYFLCVL